MSTVIKTGLHVYDDVAQGTDEWHALRRGIVTASVIDTLITTKTMKPAANDTSRALTAHLVAERITGYTEPTFVSADMERGNFDEPFARGIYSEHYAEVTEVGFMILNHSDYQLGYSPDGLVGDDGLIEIKSRRQKKHLQTILADEVPAENMAQIQCGLLVSGRKWCDYLSYCGGMPMWFKRVLPDQRWFDAIHETVTAFEENAAQMIATYNASVTGLPMTERIELYADMEF
ncbi:lambda exonuclease family protein [Arthrobacter bambusae]|uniref:lambda exonuclease family protein n=1 Tax=Arthrobacter bambusae TaxID=1338426 RepID=UPI00278813DC|nr:lambda exonuclease family protein [Arthrobacter bambusae]MDQ0241227.1 hypothetical protein [Arthrobacter bambusae]